MDLFLQAKLQHLGEAVNVGQTLQCGLRNQKEHSAGSRCGGRKSLSLLRCLFGLSVGHVRRASGTANLRLLHQDFESAGPLFRFQTPPHSPAWEFFWRHVCLIVTLRFKNHGNCESIVIQLDPDLLLSLRQIVSHKEPRIGPNSDMSHTARFSSSHSRICSQLHTQPQLHLLF